MPTPAPQQIGDSPRPWTFNVPVRVVQEVRRRGITTRAEIEAATGVSQPTQARLIDRLVDAGFLAETQRKIRRSTPLQLAPDVGAAVGVDLTLDTATVAVTDAGYGLLNDPGTATVTVPIGQAEATLTRIAQVVADELGAASLQRDDIIGLGLGIPGPVERDSGRPSSEWILPGWKGIDVGRWLQRSLADRGWPDVRCVVGNDASLGGLGVYTRAVFHNLAEAPLDLVYVRITHGIGAGLVLKGHLVTGGRGFAGEIGHFRVSSGGALCPRCGVRGCLETIASEFAVQEEIRVAARLGAPDKVTIAQALGVSHPSREHALREAGHHIGSVLSHAVNLLNPRWIVLGGAIAEQSPFSDAVEDAVHRRALPELAEAVDIRTWERLFADETASADDGGRRGGRGIGDPGAPDIGQRMSPELLGALALVIDELGDAFVLPRVERWYRAGRATEGTDMPELP